MLKKHIKNKILLNLVELIISAAIAGAVFALVYFFIARTGLVDGASMEPTLSDRELVLINQISYAFSEPKLGDIIAFPYPAEPEKLLIKRVIGVAGDVIDYVDYTIYLNGELLPEEYRFETGGAFSTAFPLTVPEGTVFVLGDNRRNSLDSRYSEVGCVPVSSIMGKTKFRIFPLNKFGLLK